VHTVIGLDAEGRMYQLDLWRRQAFVARGDKAVRAWPHANPIRRPAPQPSLDQTTLS
jgi:hypothetical protein